jgi:hypothetical protein
MYHAQWTMENLIGNLGRELRQPSNPYANLSERGLRRCQVNSLKAMDPTFDRDGTSSENIPRGAVDIGGGYAFLPAIDTVIRSPSGEEEEAIRRYLESRLGVCPILWSLGVRRCARLRIPITGQVARSRWKEQSLCRVSRNVKVHIFYCTVCTSFLVDSADYLTVLHESG